MDVGHPMTGRTYAIRTVADFIRLTDDQRKRCLAEFALWCSIHSGARKKFGDIEDQLPSDTFEWIDDGRTDVNIISPGDET